MSSKDYLYPDVSPQQLKMIEVMRRLHKEHGDYFFAPECPYPQEVERYFRSWFDKPIDGSTSNEAGGKNDRLTGSDRYDELYLELVDVYTSLKNAKPSAGDSSESMSYFRTATSLLEKLLGYQERALGIKAISEFHATVTEIMESVLTEDQRNTVMERMKNAINSN